MRLISILARVPGFKNRTYPIRITIVKERGNIRQEIPDRARKVKFIEGGKKKKLKSWQLHLLYDNVDIPLPSNIAFDIDHKGREQLWLLNPRPGVYLPLKKSIVAAKGELELVLQTQGRMAWLIGTLKKHATDVNVSANWEKYLPIITLGIVGVIMIFSMLFYAQGLEKQMGLMNQVVGALERVIDKLGNVAPQ